MNPDPIPPETPTLAALGLGPALPATAPADDAATVREVQDAAALTWLAVAELQPAPGVIWQGIQSRTTPALAPPPRLRRWQPLVTWGGWAAAALLAAGWWQQAAPVPGTPAVPENPPANPPLAITKPAAPAPPVQTTPAESALREDLLQLRQRLAEATPPTEAAPGTHRPAILELRTPGNATAASPAESNARLQQLVTRALQRDLLFRNAQDGSSIVLERGWPTAGWLAADSGQSIRHLSFPADRWEELGLWKATGQFFDPASSLTWTPAPDGLGYIGRVTPVPPDPSLYQVPAERLLTSQPTTPAESQPTPSGYLVSEPGTRDATLLLSNLPEVPPGSEQVVIATAADGSWQQYQIAANGTLSLGHAVLPGTGPLSDSITLSSFSVADGTHNFSVIQRPIGTTGGTVILSGGQP